MSMLGAEGRDGRVNPIESGRPQEWGLDKLQGRVADIYETHDRMCGYEPADMLGKLQGNIINLSQFLRHDLEFSHVDRALTNVVIWTATFANAAEVNVQNVLSEKFGSGCPHCYQMPCLLTTGAECKIPEGVTSRPVAENVPQTIDDWQTHLGIMYRNDYPNNEFSLEAARKVSLRILEEAAELVAASYSDVQAEQQLASFDDGMKPWESEIADVLAWSFALANGLKLRNGYSLGKSLQEKYAKGCFYCGLPQCGCTRTKTFIKEFGFR